MSMELPSTREIELEALVRERDAQIGELKDEISQLRQHVSSQPTLAISDPVSLPPTLVSLLLPHMHDHSVNATPASNTVTAALTQRQKVLQEENDELYEILKTGETGRLKDDVRSLRRVVQKLEVALKESHQTIESLSDELEKSQTLLLQSNNRANNYNRHPHSHSQSPVSRPNSIQHQSHTSTNGARKPLPTGPRAHKKPRLLESHSSSRPPLPHLPKANRSQGTPVPRDDSRERSPRVSSDRKTPHIKPEIDEGVRDRHHSSERKRESRSERGRERNGAWDRERGKGRDRQRPRDRDRDRERGDEADYDRSAKRNNDSSGGSGKNEEKAHSPKRTQHRTSNGSSNSSMDRTLAERMGL